MSCSESWLIFVLGVALGFSGTMSLANWVIVRKAKDGTAMGIRGKHYRIREEA